MFNYKNLELESGSNKMSLKGIPQSITRKISIPDWTELLVAVINIPSPCIIVLCNTNVNSSLIFVCLEGH